MWVDHERKPGGSDCLEHFKKMTVVVHACPRRVWILPAGVDDHVDLVGGDPEFGHTCDLVGIRCRRVVVVVDDAFRRVEVQHFTEGLDGGRRRPQIRHPEDRRNPTGCRSLGAGGYVLLVSPSRLASMHMNVDHPRDNEVASRVNYLTGV